MTPEQALFELANRPEGVTFDELFLLGEEYVYVAEALVNRQKVLTRTFVERATGRVLPQDEVSQLFKDLTEAGKAAREATDVIYRLIGGRS